MLQIVMKKPTTVEKQLRFLDKYCISLQMIDDRVYLIQVLTVAYIRVLNIPKRIHFNDSILIFLKVLLFQTMHLQ